MLKNSTLNDIIKFKDFDCQSEIFKDDLQNNGIDLSIVKATELKLINSKEGIVSFRNEETQLAFKALFFLKLNNVNFLNEIDFSKIFGEIGHEKKEKINFYIIYFLYKNKAEQLIQDITALEEHQAYYILKSAFRGIWFYHFTTEQYLNISKLTSDKNLKWEFLLSIAELSKFDYEASEKLLAECYRQRKVTHAIDLFGYCVLGIANHKGIEYVLGIINELLSSLDEDDIKLALFSISQIDYSLLNNKEYLPQFLKHIKVILTTSNTKLLESTIHFYSRLIKFSSELIPELNLLLLNGSPEVKCQVVNLLSGNIDLLKNNSDLNVVFYNSIRVFKDLTMYHGLNTICYQLLDIDKEKLIDFFEKYIKSEYYSEQNFKQFIKLYLSIKHKDDATFQSIVANYLNNENPNFHKVVKAISDNLTISGNYTLQLPKTFITNLSDSDQEFVVNKIMGYIYNHETQLNLLLSILENTKSNRIKGLICSLLRNYIGYNYPSIVNVLKQRKNNYVKSIQKLFDQIIASIDDYYEQKRKLPKLKELKPSPERIKLFMKIQNKHMEQAMSSRKSEGSSFLDFVSTVNLKAGKTWFTKYDDKYTPPAALSAIESSFELPRGEYIDPIQQAFSRMAFKSYKRNK